MDNQQERSLSWLAGILDGEGTISVQVYTKPDGTVRLTPFVAIVNSDTGIIDEVSRILDEMQVAWRGCSPRVSDGRYGGYAGKKLTWSIRLDGAKPVRQFCETIQPYLKSEKRRKASVVLEYLDSRAERGIERNEKGQIRRVEYSGEEIDLISSIRSHPRAKSSQAIRQAPNVIG